MCLTALLRVVRRAGACPPEPQGDSVLSGDAQSGGVRPPGPLQVAPQRRRVSLVLVPGRGLGCGLAQ